MSVIHLTVTVPATTNNILKPHVTTPSYRKAWCSNYGGFKHPYFGTIYEDRITCKRCLRLLEKEKRGEL